MMPGVKTVVAHGKGDKVVVYKPVYTVGDAAAELHISRQMVYRLIQKGRIKVMRIHEDGRYAISGEDLKEFVDSRKRMKGVTL